MLASVRNEWIFTNKVYHRILYYEKWCMFSFPPLSISPHPCRPAGLCACFCSSFYWTIKSRRRILRSTRPEGTAPVVVHRMRTIYSCKYTQICFFSFPFFGNRSTLLRLIVSGETDSVAYGLNLFIFISYLNEFYDMAQNPVNKQRRPKHMRTGASSPSSNSVCATFCLPTISTTKTYS